MDGQRGKVAIQFGMSEIAARKAFGALRGGKKIPNRPNGSQRPDGKRESTLRTKRTRGQKRERKVRKQKFHGNC